MALTWHSHGFPKITSKASLHSHTMKDVTVLTPPTLIGPVQIPNGFTVTPFATPMVVCMGSSGDRR